MKHLFLSNENSFVLDRKIPDIIKWDTKAKKKKVNISDDVSIVIEI